MVIVDDYCRGMWIIRLKYKHEMRAKLKLWQAQVETKWSKILGKPVRVQALKTDNAGEFISKVFRDYLFDERVDHELSVPRCSPQNGVAERSILRLTIMVRHALVSRRLEPVFWVDAFDFAAHLSWMLPTRANPGEISPWQRVTGLIPDPKHLRVFGSTVYSYVTLPERERLEKARTGNTVSGKILPACEVGIFLGYSHKHVGYRCFFPHRNRVLIRRHVIFDERPLLTVDALESFRRQSTLASSIADKSVSIAVDPAAVRDFDPHITTWHRSFIGHRFTKMFVPEGSNVRRPFPGRITDVWYDEAGDQVCWDVQYPDGDHEDLNAAELSEFVPEVANPPQSAVADPPAPDAAPEAKLADTPSVFFSGTPPGRLSYDLPTADRTDLRSLGIAALAFAPMAALMLLRAHAGFGGFTGVSFFVRYMCLFGAFAHVTSTNTHGIQHMSLLPLAAWGGNRYLQPSSCLGCPLASSIPYQFEELSSKSQHFLAMSSSSATRAVFVQWIYLVDSNGNLIQTLARDVPIPKNAKAAVNDPLYGKHWRKSIDDEIQAMFDNGVWEMVKLPNDPTINLVDTKLVFKCKALSNGLIDRFRSRLVARGFTQIEGIDYWQTFAPVVRGASFRLQICDAVRRGLKLYQMDFKSAFLQSPIDGEIYIKPPPQVKVPRGYVLRLLKGLYGLKQGAFLWFQALSTLLLAIGFTRCPVDPALWVLDTDEGYISLSTWVDDCSVATSDDSLWTKVYERIKSVFPVGEFGPLQWHLGMRVRQAIGTVELDLAKYIGDMLAKYGLSDASTSNAALQLMPQLVSHPRRTVPNRTTRNWTSDATHFVVCLAA